MINFEELEMHTDSLCFALARKELEDCILLEMKAEWKRLRSKDYTNSFIADAVANFSPRKLCDKHKKLDERERGLFKEQFRCTEKLCLCRKTYCCFDVTTDHFKTSSKGLNKLVLDHNGDRPLEKYRRLLDENVNITSTNRGFRTNNHSFATHEQFKIRLS